VLTGVHIGLLTVVFIGLAAPPALAPTLGRQLSAAYDVAFQRELLEEGGLAAYTAVSSRLAAQPESPVLAGLVTSLDDISPPEGSQRVSETAAENARLLGEAEALALALPAPPSLGPTARDATAAAGDEDPVTDPLDSDPALARARAEDPLDAAVDIINQARYAQDQSGPCAGCTVPGNGDDNQPGDEPPEDHPEDP
jgi:hypothetical protein